MNSPSTLRNAVQRLREQAGLSQAELAKRLPFTASRLSRLMSGELTLSVDETGQIARAIGTSRADDFAEYLSQEWLEIEKVSFDHLSRPVLWEAEQSLQRLKTLAQKPDLKNAFVKQVQSCQTAMERAAGFLARTDHPIAFVGSPGVGKTTAICSLANLRDSTAKGLNKQMALPTGSGRTTICEVHIRNGGDYSVAIEPCPDDELRQLVCEFCDHVRELAGLDNPTQPGEGASVSEEVVRALRNMTGLTVKRFKEPDGKRRQEDPAVQLAKEFDSREEFHIRILSQLDLPRRWRTSISFPRDSTVEAMEWLSRTIDDINYGRHPEFSLPKRIEISVPSPMLNKEHLDIRLIDTRGVDEPAAPRRDLQAYFDDERAIVVFCSGFKDAPDGAMQTVLDRAGRVGLQSELSERGILLVLPQGGEEANVRDSTGDLVADYDEGRDVRLAQAQTTLRHRGFADLKFEFLDATNSGDSDRVAAVLVNQVCRVRCRIENQLSGLIDTVDQLIENRTNEEVRLVFEHATHRVETWLASHVMVPEGQQHVQDALLEDIENVHASTLRASVNRLGDYQKFDYWHGLGSGARRNAKQRTDKLMIELHGVIQNAVDDEQLSHAHDFLRHFETQVDEGYKGFLLSVQALGEMAFREQFKADREYWTECQAFWGQGAGYRLAVKGRTSNWFSEDERFDLHKFLESEVQRMWTGLLEQLAGQLKTAKPKPGMPVA